MLKKKFFWIVLDSVFIVVFNLIFFLVKEDFNNNCIWISYFFIHFSYLVLVMSSYLTVRNNRVTLGYPIYTLTSIYFVVSFFIAIIFILFDISSYKFTTIIYVLLTGAFLVSLLTYMISNEKIKEDLERSESEREYVKLGSTKLQVIMNQLQDKNRLKEVEKLYDLLHSSPMKSNEYCKKYEIIVLNYIDRLEDSVSSNSDDFDLIVKEIEQNAFNRNKFLNGMN